MKSIDILNTEKKSCRMEYDKSRKIFTITLEGFLVIDESTKDFFNHYMDIAKELNKDETTLIINGKDLKPFEQEFIDQLEGLYREYSTYSKVYCVRSMSAISNSQTQRLIKKLGLQDKFTFVDNISEIK